MPDIVLQARGLAKAFASPAGRLPVLTNVSLEVFAGESVSIRGSSGSGKTTLIKLLTRLYLPTAGRILIDNIDMGQIHPRDLRRSVGYLGQEVRLFSGTIRDNLNLSQLERDDDRLFEALEFAGLGPFAVVAELSGWVTWQR